MLNPELDLKVTAALDSTITYITKGRKMARAFLMRWFDFCSQNAEFSDGACNAASLRVYSDRFVDQAEAKGSGNLHSIFQSFCANISPLWIVWVHSSTDSDQARKAAFEVEYVKVKKIVKQRLEIKYASAPNAVAVQTPVSPRETPDLASLAIEEREDARESVNSSSSRLVLQGASLNTARAAMTIQSRFTNANGEARSFDSSPMDHGWRIFSYESDAFLHSVLLRRSSQCSLQMRLWHALSVSTWLDSDALCKGITLGSLSMQSNRRSVTATANVITIQTKRTDNGLSRHSSNGAADGKELRNSRSASAGGQCKIELLRHRRIILCPWNALAAFLFHKWHVLNVPPPDFSNSAWMSEPLFQGGAALSDVHLLDFCGEHYREYQREFEQGKQTYKSMSQRAYTAMEMSLSSSQMLRATVSTSKTLVVTQRSLQNGVYDNMLVYIAGFSTDLRAQPYHISRQQPHALFADLEHMIFPFADYLPDYSEGSYNGIEVDQRQTTIGFCNMLKLLRTILLQDAALLLYTPFYRQMLRHSSVFGSPIFLSETFRDKSDINGEALMTSDCKPMYGSMPHDTRLGKVRPALTGSATQQLASPRPGGSVNSPRLPRQGQLSGLAEAFPDPQNSVADEPASAKPSEKASSCRLSRLRQLKEQLEEDSPGLTDSAADKLATESDEASALRRMTRLRQLKEMLDDTQDTKRRRVEKASTLPARLEHAPARVPRMAFSQRSPDSGVRRISMPSPSASIYLVEDEDGNFVDKPREPQAILPGDGDPVGPMDWEALSFDFINDGALSNRTPESISDGAVPELDFAAAVPALPKAAPLLESDSDNMVSDVEALPASSDSLSAEPAVALAQVLGKVCQAQKLLLKPGLRIRKSMLKMHVFVKRIVALRAKTARSLVSGGVVDSNAVERMRELGMLLQRTKNILAKLEEMVGSNGDLLGELMSSGVEEALGNAAVLLSHPLSDSASH